MTTPEKDLWVNLSPYERNRIVPESFGQTEMGRDLLAQDYMLKQITASLIYPEDEIGKKFWKRVYEEAAKKFGTTNIPVNTFNKVWIVPGKAVVYENAKAGAAYVVESKLKVMLEQDYLALEKSGGHVPEAPIGDRYVSPDKGINALGSNIVREIVIPALTKEVNTGKNFTQLRQVYHSLILAAWYKKKIKDSILSQVYIDKNKTVGVDIDNPEEKQKIYERYLQAFKNGVYNYIKEDHDPVTQQVIPRKYFSGGVDVTNMASRAVLTFAPVLSDDTAAFSDRAMSITVRIKPIISAAMASLGLGPDVAFLRASFAIGEVVGISGFALFQAVPFLENHYAANLALAIVMGVGGVSAAIIHRMRHFTYDATQFYSDNMEGEIQDEVQGQGRELAIEEEYKLWWAEYKPSFDKAHGLYVSHALRPYSYQEIEMYFDLLRSVRDQIKNADSSGQQKELGYKIMLLASIVSDIKEKHGLSFLEGMRVEAIEAINEFLKDTDMISSRLFLDTLQKVVILKSKLIPFLVHYGDIHPDPVLKRSLPYALKLNLNALEEWGRIKRNEEERVFPFSPSYAGMSRMVNLLSSQGLGIYSNKVVEYSSYARVYQKFLNVFTSSHHFTIDRIKMEDAQKEEVHRFDLDDVRKIKEIRRIPVKYRQYIKNSADRHRIPFYLIVSSIMTGSIYQRNYPIYEGFEILSRRLRGSADKIQFIKKQMPAWFGGIRIGTYASTAIAAMVGAKSAVGMTKMRPIWVKRADGFRAFGIDANKLSDQEISWLLFIPEYAIEAAAAMWEYAIQLVADARRFALNGIEFEGFFSFAGEASEREHIAESPVAAMLLPAPGMLGDYKWILAAFHPNSEWFVRHGPGVEGRDIHEKIDREGPPFCSNDGRCSIRNFG
ncbi:MAG: hypothetical protein HY591_05460 [Candidatus Omnitrophica bacterium]|nr:hypothetical protein [Candidatus Omnitrophota bacterium]